MIEMTTLSWFALGLFAGLVHATMLWRNVHSHSVWSPLIGFLRLAIVASLLVVAAINGAILANAAGWAVGFVLLAAWLRIAPEAHASDPSTSPSGESR